MSRSEKLAMKKLAILAAASALAVTATPASAAIVITASPGAVQPPENVLTNTSMTGLTVMGATNQTNAMVSVRSTETLTTTTSNGQSRFLATDGSFDAGSIFLTGGGTFTSAEFNLFSALAGTTSVEISINGGPVQTFALGGGENFFGISATGGDTITSIAFDTNGSGVSDLRQLRLGGVAAAVPEPGTWALMLLGFGVVGASMRRRRRTTHLPQFA
jgi:hypothetical protein